MGRHLNSRTNPFRICLDCGEVELKSGDAIKFYKSASRSYCKVCYKLRKRIKTSTAKECRLEEIRQQFKSWCETGVFK